MLQSTLAVQPGDTAATLAARVQATEHIIYPRALGWFAQGRLAWHDNAAWLDAAARGARRGGFWVRQSAVDCSGRRSARLRRVLGAALAGALASVLLASGVAAADELKPFEASYAWIWNGMTVAVTTLKLAKSGADTDLYLAQRAARHRQADVPGPRDQSVLRVTPGGVEPLSYKGDDGTSSSQRSIDLKHDWSTHRVSGVYEQTLVDLPLTAQVQDDSSIQIALMVALLRGQTPDRFDLIDKDAVREYHHARAGRRPCQHRSARCPRSSTPAARRTHRASTATGAHLEQGYSAARAAEAR